MVNASPYIGKLFGIKVQLHWTFILLMLFSLLLALLDTSFLYFFALIVLLFVCVFIHELFHSINGVRNRVKIKKIILLPIGGASVIDDREEIDPDVEFRMVIVGPLASILLGVIFGIAVIYVQPGIAKQALQFLFEINILLGVFNLLPGFPLDGGRLLRSYLEKRSNIVEATRKTIKVSNAFVVVFVIATIIYAAILPNYSFLNREFLVFWDLIVAIFLYNGSRDEMDSVYLKYYASKLRIRDAVSRNYVLLNASTPISRLYDILAKAHTHIILVRSGKEIRLVSRIPQQKDFERHNYKTVNDLSARIATIDYGEKLSAAISLMRSENSGIVAVTERGKLKGVVFAQHAESIIALHAQRLSRGGASIKS